jgi:hypothetical protein
MADLKKLMEDIKGALVNLVTLEIITAVGPITVKRKDSAASGPMSSFPDIEYDPNLKMIQTKIDLLQGDIKTIFDPEFVTGNYQSLRDFHAAREKQGSDIISNNLKALKELFNWVSSLL